MAKPAKGKLSEYSAKRAFDVTPEPAGELADSGCRPAACSSCSMHAARRLHYDFRLECDGVLLSWAVPKGPSFDREDKRLAVMTEDHPYDYASFEGVIPSGQYGAGERHRLGLRRLQPRRRRRLVPRPRGSAEADSRRPREGQAQHPAARRKAQGLVRARAHEGREDVAHDQAPRPVRGQGGRDAAESLGAVGRDDRRSVRRARASDARRRSSCRRATLSRCRNRSRRCSRRSATRRSTIRNGCGSRSSTAIA